ncbi:unnamed protein product [Macrosiphum euphorbiae]|uniref:Uncharacterized protein n=1 Tax=Macrosiphum euphorbiae TaxID=13131 RepID=A0AAV0VKJ3_9HEMI|nr:unnamed protein product [Macrosiphum euphorbiae]
MDVKRNQRFTALEEKNSQVDQKYYDMMKNCRALSGEDYEVYVMRLINIGCRPLGDIEWRVESDDTGKNNVAATL